jgi:serine/threonine-protein kinase RsbW
MGRSAGAASAGGSLNLTTASRHFKREIASLGGIFAFLAEFAVGNGISEGAAFKLNLVVEELFTNMVRHNEGGGDHIELSLERSDVMLHLELTDVDVEPFDPATVEEVPVGAGIEARRPGGLGIHLVRTMVDSLDYSYEPANREMKISVTTTLE